MLAKRLTLSLLAIGVISLIVTAASFALFTDTTTNATNTFTAGTVSLDNPTDFLCPLPASNLAPGDSGACTIKVKYTGSLDAYLGIVPPTGTGALFLGSYPVAIGIPTDGTTPFDLYLGKYVVGRYAKDAVADVTIPYTWDSHAGDTYQGASGTISVQFVAVQARNNEVGAPGVHPDAWE